MGFIRNLLALIGLIAIIGGAVAYALWGDMIGQASEVKEDIVALKQLPPKARNVYKEMWQKLKATGSSADATVISYSVDDGVTWQQAEAAMRFKAKELNVKNVGELALSRQAERETGVRQRFLKIYQFCNPQTAMQMVDFSDAFSAYLPCRIALIEDKQGQLQLYSLNMDMMIYGGKPLPPEIEQAAEMVKQSLTAIMVQGATGEAF